MVDLLRSWQMDFGGCSNLELFLDEMYPQIHDKLTKELSELDALSFKLTVKLQMRMDHNAIHLSLCHRRMIILDVHDIEKTYMKFLFNLNTIL